MSFYKLFMLLFSYTAYTKICLLSNRNNKIFCVDYICIIYTNITFFYSVCFCVNMAIYSFVDMPELTCLIQESWDRSKIGLFSSLGSHQLITISCSTQRHLAILIAQPHFPQIFKKGTVAILVSDKMEISEKQKSHIMSWLFSLKVQLSFDNLKR